MVHHIKNFQGCAKKSQKHLKKYTGWTLTKNIIHRRDSYKKVEKICDFLCTPLKRRGGPFKE